MASASHGHDIQLSAPKSTQKKKRPTIKLACVLLFFLSLYGVFVYLIWVTFEKYKTTERDVQKTSHLRSDSVIVRLKESGILNKSIRDFKVDRSSLIDQRNQVPFDNHFSARNNGNSVLLKIETEVLQALLTGSILKNIDRTKIEISRQKNRTRDAEENDQRLQTHRTIEDIVSSVLNAAKHGSHQYDTGGESTLTVQDGRTPEMPVLTAYCEPVNQTDWNTKPLPVRTGPATKSSLFPIAYPHLTSCRNLSSQWPIDTPPVDLDPFLPWIHDVFPASDGKNVIFIAQNRRRCFNGQRGYRGEQLPDGVTPHGWFVHIAYERNYFMRPQAALFQHVPLKKMSDPDDVISDEPRYRLASHEDADPEGMETRFICRFKKFDPEKIPRLSIVGFTLSQFELDYDYHTYRKGYLRTHSEAGYDNHIIWTSQLLFKCPIPREYHDRVKNGETVVNDYATLFVDLIPIRTPPRYTPPREFFPPRYKFKGQLENLFVPDNEWGSNHVLPKIDESGRWENIPVCMPSLMTYGIVPKGMEPKILIVQNTTTNEKMQTIEDKMEKMETKIHKVIACTWASTTFQTRSNRAQVGDGKRRLKEWLEFHLLAGFDHIYVYDNSGAFTNEDSLANIIEIFPSDKVTRIDWPCKICSNRDGNEGERSSQYAAESSCRLRFGTHARWLGSFDTDEYLVPMGNFFSMGQVADYLDRKGVYIAEFKSCPAKPRFDLLEEPKNTETSDGTFTPTVKEEETFLHTYNCNSEQFPRSNALSHRSKQMYRADFVKLHYVHYSTATVVSQMTEEETINAGLKWKHKYKEGHLHQFFELNEATMLHTKSKVARNTHLWQTICKERTTIPEGGCSLGFPFPNGSDQGSQQRTQDGWAYNCFINEKIEYYWWPKLMRAIERRENSTKSALNITSDSFE